LNSEQEIKKDNTTFWLKNTIPVLILTNLNYSLIPVSKKLFPPNPPPEIMLSKW
jgi:hypothetical protein